jgi:aromatic ring hydroxylase
MGARRGQEYIEGLRDGRRIYVKGELVRDVTSYPRSKASYGRWPICTTASTTPPIRTC